MAEIKIIITDTDKAARLINVRMESNPPLPDKGDDMTPGQHYAACLMNEIADSLLEDEANQADGAKH
jgi:hypothetical protein